MQRISEGQKNKSLLTFRCERLFRNIKAIGQEVLTLGPPLCPCHGLGKKLPFQVPLIVCDMRVVSPQKQPLHLWATVELISCVNVKPEQPAEESFG